MSPRIGLASGLFGLVMAFSANAALIINELDSDSVNTPSTDAFEFVELFDTSGTSVPLDGYVLVYYNGNGNVVYRAQDLDGLSTRANGYFIAGSIAGADLAIPGNSLQNGVDAVALYQGDAASFPNGTAPTTTNLIDAVVYRTGADTDGVGLDTALLLAGSSVDEWGRDGTATTGVIDSIGRIPNAAGGVRDTTSWTVTTPTPGLPNVAAIIPEPASAILVFVATLFLAARRSPRRQ